MRFRFQPLRAAQAVGVLVRLAGGRLNYTKALKLLYLADRRSLLETGTTITGDRVVNMTNGPVLSGVCDCIKGNTYGCDSWNATFKTDAYDLVLVSDPGDDELSDYDIELLKDAYDAHLTHNWKQMVDFVHDLPEWEDPGVGRARPLDYAEILRAGDVSTETIQAYEALNASLGYVDSVRIVRA